MLKSHYFNEFIKIDCCRFVNVNLKIFVELI